MKASICVGSYAERPYTFKNLGIRVFCLEELCYALKENAFLLDAEIMSDELMEWIGNNCGLSQLAGELYPLVHRSGSLSAFVTMIQEYCGFYDTGVIRQMEQTLKKGAGWNIFEKRNARCENLVNRGKHAAALGEYNALLAEWNRADRAGENPGPAKLYSAMLHNKGTVLAKMMRYGEAAEFFCQAYETDGEEESLLAYFAAKRMVLPEGDYIDFAADRQEDLDISLMLERNLEKLADKWQEDEDYQLLQRRKEWREDTDRQLYRVSNKSLMKTLVDDYRSSINN